MLIEIILFIIISVVMFLFARLNYKKCETGGEKIIFIFYIIIISIPIILYYLDLWNIPSRLNLIKNMNSQNWLNFLFTYVSTIVSSVIGVTASIYIAFIQIRKNNEDNEKRDKENLRVQNMPLLKYNINTERKCEGDISVEIDGIPKVVSSKFLIRLFYNKNEVLSQHLEDKLLEHNSNLADVEIFLNQEISDIQETLDFGYIDEELEFLEITKEFTANFSKKGMFTIPRESSKYLFSILPYESRCNFEVDGIKAEGRLNLLLRCRLDKETLEYLNSSKNIGDKIIIKFPVLK